MTYFDFAKAFDTVPTKGILAKIQSYGIHGNMLGLIHRSFQYNEMLIHLYNALVRPHVQYASSVWLPFELRDIKLIVQRSATRLSRDLLNEPYNIRLTTLGLPTLQFRRDRADMLQVFKILNG